MTDKMPSLGEMELLYIAKVLEVTKGNRTEAAAILKIDRKTLYRKLELIGDKVVKVSTGNG